MNEHNEWNMEGVFLLAAGIIKRAYDDLVDCYETMLFIKYPNHSENTQCRYKDMIRSIEFAYRNNCKKKGRNISFNSDDFIVFKEHYIEDKYLSSLWRKREVLSFFDSEHYRNLSQGADAGFFIKRAKVNAIKWFADKDSYRTSKNEKLQIEITKKALKRRKRLKRNKRKAKK